MEGLYLEMCFLAVLGLATWKLASFECVLYDVSRRFRIWPQNRQIRKIHNLARANCNAKTRSIRVILLGGSALQEEREWTAF